MTQRIVLEHADFAALVRGRAIEKQGVKMILADIGFALMHYEVTAAENGQPPYNFRETPTGQPRDRHSGH